MLLCACSANPPPSQAKPVTGGPSQPTPVHGVTPGHACTTAGTDRFVGQQGTSANADAILRASNAAVLRWSPPNTMLTMDYRQDRVTIWLDEANKITKIRCG
jgi:hypothetical protein